MVSLFKLFQRAMYTKPLSILIVSTLQMKVNKLFEAGIKAKCVLRSPFLSVVQSSLNPGWPECCVPHQAHTYTVVKQRVNQSLLALLRMQTIQNIYQDFTEKIYILSPSPQ